MKMDSKEIAGKVDDWINLAQNREGGGMFWTWEWTSRFHKMREISWLPEEISVSQEWFLSMQLVSYKITVHLHRTRMYVHRHCQYEKSGSISTVTLCQIRYCAALLSQGTYRRLYATLLQI
jgi:hypothetical protein